MTRFAGLFLAFLLFGGSAFAGPLTLLGTGKPGASAPAGLTFIAGTSIKSTGAGPINYAVSMTGPGGTAAPTDLIFIFALQASGGAGFTLTGTGATCTQQGPGQSDGAFNYTIFICPLAAGDISNGNITGTGLFNGSDISVAIYRGGTTWSTPQWATDAASNAQIFTPALTPGGGSLGWVIMTTGYGYNVANTLSASPDTWTFDVQNIPVDAFWANSVATSTNSVGAITTLSGFGTQVKGGFRIEVTP